MKAEILSLDTAAKLTKYDNAIKYCMDEMKRINPKKLSNSELYKITPDMKMQVYYTCKKILEILEVIPCKNDCQGK